MALAELPVTRCSDDLCAVRLASGGKNTDLLLARSRVNLPWKPLVEACACSDIVIADRRMPRGCTPRWLKIDRWDLARHGGAAFFVDSRHVERSRDPRDDHPWVIRPRSSHRRPATATAVAPQL
jgi:competence protein ComEC